MSKVIKAPFKAAKKVISKVHDFGKKVVKGVVKGFKKFASSTIGKVIIAVVAIWLGGWALGVWGPGTGAAAGTALAAEQTAAAAALQGGAAAAGGAAAESAAFASITAAQGLGGAGAGVVGAGAGSAAAGSALAELGPAAYNSLQAAQGLGGVGAAAGGATGAVSAAQTPTAGSAAAELGAQGAGDLAAAQAASVGGEVAASGIVNTIRGLGKSALGFAKENQLVTYGLMTGLGSALTKPQYEAEREYAEEDRLRREANLDVSGIDTGLTPTRKPLTDYSGNRIYNQQGRLADSGYLYQANPSRTTGLIANARGKS